MNKHTLLNATLLALVIALQVVGFVSAQEQTPGQVTTPSDDDVNRIAKQLYCPVCENIPLDVCDTTACERWRGVIRDKLATGWNDEDIKDYFVLQYGDRVLAEPPRRGLNWLVYILPLVFFIGGIYILYRVFQRMRPSAVNEQPGIEDKPEPRDPYVARVEEALRERRK